MKNVSQNILPMVAVAASFVCGCYGISAAEPRLEAVFGAEGLHALKWADADVLKDGTPHVSRLILEKKWLGDDGLNEYDFEELGSTDPEVSFDRGNNVLTHG